VTGSNMKARLLRAALLAFGLVVGCGGSASRGKHDAQPASSTGGAAGDRSGTAGANAVAGSAAAAAAGGSVTSAGGAPGEGGPEDFGGMADAGAAPVLSLPPGCEPRTPKETADVCSLAVDCDKSPSVRTYCHRLDSGQWECQCANQERIFRVENVAGLEACALSAGLCADTSPALGPERCELTNDISDQDSCSTDIACRSPIDLGGTTDEKAWLVRVGSARCSRSDSATALDCSCLNGTLASNYFLLADSGKLACGPLADFCMSGETPVFDGKETCSSTYFSSDSEGCQRFASCGSTMALTDGVSLAQGRERYANCAASPGGGSECSCSEQDSAFLFHLATAPDDASCESSILNCDRGAVIKTTAPASCQLLVLDAYSADMCDANLSCVQDATVDNRSIQAEFSLGLLCRRAQAGMPWSCSCASGQKTARFALGATGASPSQACTQAKAGCLEQLGAFIGPSGDNVSPPDPP
jgi:hypothetical protein